MLYEISNSRTFTRRNLNSDSEARTLAQSMAKRWNTAFVIKRVRPRDGKKRFVMKVKAR
jgi:hypothetical protein